MNLVQIIFVAVIIGAAIALFAPKDNRYADCTVVDEVRTGETSIRGSGPSFTYYETVRTWNCRGESKLQVVWER